jgi:hypothetical protein
MIFNPCCLPFPCWFQVLDQIPAQLDYSLASFYPAFENPDLALDEAIPAPPEFLRCVQAGRMPVGPMVDRTVFVCLYFSYGRFVLVRIDVLGYYDIEA